MGLDIYLRHSNDWDTFTKRAAEHEAKGNALYEGANATLSAEQRRPLAKAIDEEYGVAEDGYTVAGMTEPEVPVSKIDPEHICKLDYLRSSYNGSGMNNVLENRGVPTLYDIFGPIDDNDYYQVIDWRNALARVDHAVKLMREFLASPTGNFSVYEISTAIDLVEDKKAAMKVFAKELERNKPDGPFADSGYNSRAGSFHLNKPLEVYAIMNGAPAFMDKGPTYVVVKNTEADGKGDFYLNALLITREMIEFVLSKEDSANYRLAWSG